MLPFANQEPTIYQIRIWGQLDPCWSDWFDEFTITNQAGDSLLTGSVPDQAALHGVLGRIRDLGLTLVSIQQVENKNETYHTGEPNMTTQPLAKPLTLRAVQRADLQAIVQLIYEICAAEGDTSTTVTPEDLENIGISLIGWVPTFMREPKAGRHTHTEQELVLAYNSDSVPAEAFRTLRTRLQFSKLEPEPIKTILITSSIPREGKTIISSNLAASFALSSRVLLLDCDFRKPRMHNIFNMKRYPGLCDYLFGTVPIEEAVRETSFPNLHIMTCGTIPTNPAELIASKHMQTFLNMIKPKYDYILIDCPPSLGLLTLNALTAADSVLIPVQCEYFALEGLGQLLNTINIVKQYYNSKLTIEGVLLTMFDTRLRLSHQVADEVRKYFGEKVYNTVINRNVRISEAPSFGKPIIHYDAVSTGAQNYMALAVEVIERNSKSINTVGNE